MAIELGLLISYPLITYISILCLSIVHDVSLGTTLLKVRKAIGLVPRMEQTKALVKLEVLLPAFGSRKMANHSKPGCFGTRDCA